MQFSSPAASFNLYIKNDMKCICVHLLKKNKSFEHISISI